MKLIATDMDGTLLRDDKTFNDEFYKYYQKMKDQGIMFVVASGNQYELLQSKFPNICDELTYICENGCKIVDKGEVLYTNTLSKDNQRIILDILSEYPECMIVFCGVKHAYVLNKFKDKIDHISKFYQNFKFVDSLHDIDDDVLKYSISDFNNINKTTATIQPRLPQGIKLVTTGHVWFDIFNDNVHKGLGIDKLREIYNIEKDECAAFGDMPNDLELLQAVKYGYAVANACDEVKEIAYEIIDSNNNDGVIKKIKEILE